jgi:hypothetical protein
MSEQELRDQIQELEQEQELNEFGSYAYDVADAELQSLYWQLDRLIKG